MHDHQRNGRAVDRLERIFRFGLVSFFATGLIVCIGAIVTALHFIVKYW